MRRPLTLFAWTLGVLAGCSTVAVPEDEPLPPGVVFTFPVDNQRDVPLGARLVISFSDPIGSESTAARVVGPSGPVDVAITANDKTLAITSKAFEPGTTYEVFTGTEATPLFRFTTRSDRPLAGPPSLVAFNGSDPLTPGELRPIFETSTIQLAFSEPLDRRSVRIDPAAITLVDAATQTIVPVTLVSNGIHVALDPVESLVADTAYELRLGDQLLDLAGDHIAPSTVTFTPLGSLGRGAARQTFRTRQANDAAAAIARLDATNVMSVEHPLIGDLTANMRPAVLATELGDPLALNGPIAFRIPRGQRLSSSALDIKLAGTIPAGLATGDIAIELLTDGGGRIYRNRYRPADTLPDNDRSPLLVDLSFDLAIYATDPTGNAVLAQTVLGVQLTGLAIADEGVLAIETLGALDINLLGISAAPTNIVLDLISDPGATVTIDQQAPSLVTSLPAPDTHDLVTDEGIELLFDEPIDIDRARAGGITLHETNGELVPSELEVHGSAVVIRPRGLLMENQGFRVELVDVADATGNAMAPTAFAVYTQMVASTDVPLSSVAVYPGAACTLAGANATSAGRCTGGAAGDDGYKPFTLAANERISVVFDQQVRSTSITLGTACNTGSVRIERVDENGACLEAVAGTLLKHQRDIAFVPDRLWTSGDRYRLRLVSGANAACDANELCGANGKAANFDRLAGTSASGGPDLVVDFVGGAATTATTLLANANPNTDVNGSGKVEAGELQRDVNRVALRIADTSGLIGSATFRGTDCLPETPIVESCMYISGAIPASLGERRDNCTLPDGTTVASCIPVGMSAQTMYSTSVSMRAVALGIGLDTDTGMSVMRVREPKEGPLEGFIVDREGVPTMVVALELYMDAPDMSLPLSQHDMHSKSLSVALEGPLTFRPDGRIAISLHNLAEVPITVGINAPLGITGPVNLVVPTGEMKLQLLSRSQRGSLP